MKKIQLLVAVLFLTTVLAPAAPARSQDLSDADMITI